MKTKYRRWLRNRLQYLNKLEAHPAGLDSSDFDDVAGIVREASRRAAAAGIPAAVKLCNVRRGGLAPATAREIVAACIQLAGAKSKSKPTPGYLTPPAVAKLYGVSADTVRQWIQSGELRATNIGSASATRPRYRIEPEAMTDFDKRRMPKVNAATPTQRRRRGRTDLIVTRFSSGR